MFQLTALKRRTAIPFLSGEHGRRVASSVDFCHSLPYRAENDAINEIID